MAGITEEVAGIEQQQGWERLFFDIRKNSQYELTCKAAKLQENRNRNRYRDVSPFDHSRVKLQHGPSDYINSNHVEVSEANRHYILSQGPLPGTSGHLWQMVWEQNSKAVIMLNKIIEKGMKKCDQYWPVDKNYPLAYCEDGFMVTLLSETDMHNFVIRELELLRIKDNETRVVYHFHYTAWPDFDVPQSPAAFLDFLACIRQYGVLENNYGPAVIHCSAGIGRSGTFILIDTCLELLQKGVPFEIRKVLLEMRKYRMGLIQTPHQLRFSYFAIAECERILLFKQSEENGYSDADGLSEAESEDYDQLCRNDNVTYDAEEDNDEIDPEEHPVFTNDHNASSSNLSENLLVDRAESLSSIEDQDISEATPQLETKSSSTPTEDWPVESAESLSSIEDEDILETTPQTEAKSSVTPSKDLPVERAESLPSIEDEDTSEATPQMEINSETANEKNGIVETKTSTINNAIDHELHSARANDVQETSDRSSEKSESVESEHIFQPIGKEESKFDEKSKPDDLMVFEQDSTKKEQIEHHSPIPKAATNTQTAIENTYKQKNPSITTFISPEKDILRKRVFETDEISDNDETSKAHNIDAFVNTNKEQKPWRPYLVGGLMVSAFGVFLFVYSKL